MAWEQSEQKGTSNGCAVGVTRLWRMSTDRIRRLSLSGALALSAERRILALFLDWLRLNDPLLGPVVSQFGSVITFLHFAHFHFLSVT